MNSLAAGILKFKKRQESCTHANPEFVSELRVPYQDCLHCSGLMKLEFPARISVFSKIPEMNGERDYQDLRSLYKSVVTNFLQSGHKSGTACIVAPWGSIIVFSMFSGSNSQVLLEEVTQQEYMKENKNV